MLWREFAGVLQQGLLDVGRAVDHLLAHVVHDRRVKPKRPGAVKYEDVEQEEPILTLELRESGMIVVSKPSGWEVDGGTTDFNDFIGYRLSEFVQEFFEIRSNPLSYDPAFNYGFIHRLDIPSSGLIIAGVNFEGHYQVRWQLNTHMIQREYFIVGHDCPPPSKSIVDARVCVTKISNDAAKICQHGKPAQTYVAVLSHLLATGPALRNEHCVTGIRIRTGRRHQIRVHLQYLGHAPVADGKYPPTEVEVSRSILKGEWQPQHDGQETGQPQSR